MLVLLVSLAAALSPVAATAQAVTAPASTFAPTGTLRAAFLGDNPALGNVDSKTGTVTGPVADLVKEIARRLGVPYVLIPASGGRDVMDRLKMGAADIGFLAYNGGRAMEVDFSTRGCSCRTRTSSLPVRRSGMYPTPTAPTPASTRLRKYRRPMSWNACW